MCGERSDHMATGTVVTASIHLPRSRSSELSDGHDRGVEVVDAGTQHALADSRGRIRQNSDDGRSVSELWRVQLGPRVERDSAFSASWRIQYDAAKTSELPLIKRQATAPPRSSCLLVLNRRISGRQPRTAHHPR